MGEDGNVKERGAVNPQEDRAVRKRREQIVLENNALRRIEQQLGDMAQIRQNRSAASDRGREHQKTPMEVLTHEGVDLFMMIKGLKEDLRRDMEERHELVDDTEQGKRRGKAINRLIDHTERLLRIAVQKRAENLAKLTFAREGAGGIDVAIEESIRRLEHVDNDIYDLDSDIDFVIQSITEKEYEQFLQEALREVAAKEQDNEDGSANEPIEIDESELTELRDRAADEAAIDAVIADLESPDSYADADTVVPKSSVEPSKTYQERYSDNVEKVGDLERELSQYSFTERIFSSEAREKKRALDALQKKQNYFEKRFIQTELSAIEEAEASRESITAERRSTEEQQAIYKEQYTATAAEVKEREAHLLKSYSYFGRLFNHDARKQREVINELKKKQTYFKKQLGRQELRGFLAEVRKRLNG